MKLVKKLLRILPFIFIICSFLIFIFTFKFNYNDYDFSGNWMNRYSNEIAYYVSEFISKYFGAFSESTFYPLWSWMQDVFLDGGGSSNYFLEIAFGTLVYELFLSILFLVFDVFNFMIGVANKWIKKGGNLDD